MAANITLSAPVVGTTGKTMTATISGGSGTGYAISGITGLIPHISVGQGNGCRVTSASVSGSTLTMNLDSTFGSGEAVRLDITTGSNLTDSAGNTPQGQNNLDATNNSTVPADTFLIDSGFFEINASAQLPAGAAFGIGANSNWESVPSDNWPVEFVVHATEISVLTYNGPATFRLDDATTDATTTGNGSADWRIQKIASGLNAGKHLVRLSFGGYFAGVRLVGGNRTMHAVPTTKRAPAAHSTALVGVPDATEVRMWGPRIPNASDGSVNVGGRYGGNIMEFGFTGSGVELYTIADPGNSYAVSVDGAAPGPLVTGGVVGNNFGLCVLAKGLDAGSHTISSNMVGVGIGTTHRAVKIVNGTRLSASAMPGATTVQVASTATLAVGHWVKVGQYGTREWRQVTGISGTTLTLNSALASAHAIGQTLTSYEAPAGTITVNTRDRSAKRLGGLGDSNTQGFNEFGAAEPPILDGDGNGYVTYDERWFPGFLAADPADWEIVDLGEQGTTTAQIAVAATNNLATFGGGTFDIVTGWPGTNDLNGGGSTYTPAQYKADVQTMANVVVPLLRPGGKFILMPPGTPHDPSLVTAGGLSLAVCLQKLQEVAATDPTHIVVASDLFDGMVDADYNGLHYHVSGQRKMAANLAPYLGVAPPGPPLVFTDGPGFYVGTTKVLAY